MSKVTSPRGQRTASVPGKGGAELHAGGEGAEIAAKSREVIDGLKKLYTNKLKPLEKRYDFGDFHSPLLSDADFEAKPQVLMIGQYSVGKTSFIEYLLGRPFPGQRVGPEPTTDRFVAVMHGDEERTVPGNAACVSPDLPYGGLSMFGTAFLNKFEAAQLPAPVLEQLTIVDTPGILSGEKQRIARGYDFTQVARWFAERSDLILLLFDAHKLDISDEFQRVIEVLQGHSDKVRCVLNKADQVDQQRLLRVYGALMWSLGKVLKTPEVMRVYLGSFWSQPRQKHGEDGTSGTPEALFDAEERDLLDELRSLPQHAAVRKVNELVKRARLAKVHACLLGHLRDKMPSMFGMEKKQRELLENMGENFREVQRKYHLPPGDFPPIDAFVRQCADRKFTKFPSLKSRELQDIDDMLTKDIPALMASLPKHTRVGIAGVESSDTTNAPSNNPFASIAPVGRLQWEEELLGCKPEYDAVFATLTADSSGRASGGSCMGPLQKQAGTGVSHEVLRAIWDLADQTKAGSLDADQFAVAMHLCARAKAGETIPTELPAPLVPPSSGKEQPHVGSSPQTNALRRPTTV
jgi:EH domain-containing protein 3